MKKRFIAAGLAATLAVSCIFSGCGKEETKVATGSNSEYAITKEPTELTLFMVRSDGKHQEDTEVWQEIAKLTNVSLKSVNSKSVSDSTQALNTLLASGNLPDLVMYSDCKNVLNKYGMEGAFAKIDELAAKYAPNIQAQLERPVVKNFVTASDGHVYYVPSLNPPTVAKGWLIRKDWLDKLNLPMPTSIDEYHDTLVAFRDGDPNGNGKKDEIPFFSRFDAMAMQDLLWLWDAFVDWNQKDGKVYYGPAAEEYKTACINIAKWYAEGLIDKEIYTRGWKTRDKLLGENTGGSTHDWFGSTLQFNEMLKDSVPGMELVAFTPPNGREYSIRDEVITQGGGISSTSKKQEIAIKFMDFVYSDMGSKFFNFGIEGKHYDMKDGKPYFQDWVINGEKTTVNILEEAGACSAFPAIQDFWYEEQWLTPEAKEGVKLYLDNNYLQEKFPTLLYTVEEETRLAEIMTALKTHVDETTQKWVYGASDVEATYDKFIADLKSMGLEEAEKIQQAAYDRYLKQQ